MNTSLYLSNELEKWKRQLPRAKGQVDLHFEKDSHGEFTSVIRFPIKGKVLFAKKHGKNLKDSFQKARSAILKQWRKARRKESWKKYLDLDSLAHP